MPRVKRYTLIKYDKKILKQFDTKINIALEEIGELLLKRVRQIVPRKTGRTSESFRIELEKNVVRIGSNWYIARFLEFGTVKMRPTPSLRIVLEKSRKDITNIFKKVIGK